MTSSHPSKSKPPHKRSSVPGRSGRASPADNTPPAWLSGRVLYRDPQLLIIDKPAGLAVHPGPKTSESLEAWLPALRFGIEPLPQPAHRLDRDTSGCLVLGRVPKAVTRLGKLFEAGEVEKLYWAIVAGKPSEMSGRIDLSLAKRSDKTGWRMVPSENGVTAITDYRCLATGGGVSLLALRPRTGRTHQIRIHCQALGCAVLGDPVYGKAAANGLPHALHARALRFLWGTEQKPIAASADLPDHMTRLLAQHGIAIPDDTEFL